MILPKLVQERPGHPIDIDEWPKCHIWGNGTLIVEEMKFVLVFDDEGHRWVRYEWAALSDFPPPDITLKGLPAISYILTRVEPLSKTGT